MEALPVLPPQIANVLAWLAVAGATCSLVSSVVTAIVERRQAAGLPVSTGLRGAEIVLSVLAVNLGRFLGSVGKTVPKPSPSESIELSEGKEKPPKP